jgi:hypothetical protein
MIYFTTFIFTLLLSHIARATPACGDVASPEELSDPAYADTQQDLHTLPIIVYNVTWTNEYDHKNGNTKNVACHKYFDHKYPHFKDFPRFPYIGGAWNVKKGSKICGTCWNLTDLKTHKTISIAPIDSAAANHYNISKEAFNVLNGGLLGSKWLQATAKEVDGHHCGFKK